MEHQIMAVMEAGMKKRIILAGIAACIFIMAVFGLITELRDETWRCPECGKLNMFPFCTRCGTGNTPSETYHPWKISIPDRFRKMDETYDSVLYYDEENKMEVYLRWEGVVFGSPRELLKDRYSEETGRHLCVTYKELKEKSFEVSGYEYDNEYIYYMHGQAGDAVYCSVYFYYPAGNRIPCDKTLEAIRDSLIVY